MRILSYCLALDGGTQVIELELDGSGRIKIGLDGRMGSPLEGRQLFIGGSPDSPDAQLLPVGGREEADVIALLEQWQDQTQGFLRREVLINADPDVLDKQDLLDRMAIEFLMKVKSREQA
jgi:hypothetical protein